MASTAKSKYEVDSDETEDSEDEIDDDNYHDGLEDDSDFVIDEYDG